MKQSGRRKLAAIMFTDIVGYSALTQRNEALAMELLEEHFQLLRSIFPEYEGVEIKTIGDAFLVAFPSALQAANCAVEIQRKMWERNQESPQDKQIVLRVGLHVGDVIHSEGDVFGDGVNIAARLEPCASPGGICLSEDVARPIRNKIDVPLIDQGSRQLKNITEPVRIYQMGLPWLPPITPFKDEAAADERGPGGFAGWLRRTSRGRRWAAALLLALAALAVMATFQFWPSAQAGPQTLALLPLLYEGPSERAATAKMLPALLVESLRESPRLSVAPFDSSREFSGDADPAQVGQELSVDWVVQGELNVAENRFDISLGLVGQDGKRQWSRQLSGEVERLFGVAEEVSGQIESALGIDSTAALPAMSRDPDAIQAYLEGKSFLEGWDVESNFERARKSFQRAVELDPNYGEAYAGLAQASWRTWEETGDDSMVAPSREAAKKAISLAPEHPESYLALGVIDLGQGRSQEAVLSFSKALKLAPADDAVCRRIADSYMSLGRDQDAEQMYRRAIALRPEFWQNHHALGRLFLNRGRFEEAKQAYRKVIDLRPDGYAGYNNLAIAHISLEEMDLAEEALKKALEIQPDNFAGVTNLGFIYYSQGRYEDAAEQFRQAAALADDHAPWLNLGDAYRQLNRPEDWAAAYGKALEFSRRRLQVNPANKLMRAAAAYSLAGMGRCEEARREASEALSGNSPRPDIHYYAAVAFAICGEDEMAADSIQKAIEGGFVADVQTNPDLRRLLDRPSIKKALESNQQGN